MDTSPRDAEGAVSLPLPRATPSLEMFSKGVETLSLIENNGALRLVGCGNQSWVTKRQSTLRNWVSRNFLYLSSVFGFTLSVDLPDPKMT